MARIELDQPLLPSVLDRLIDENPEAKRDASKSRGQHLIELRQAVRRDLEALLNTRQPAHAWPTGLDELPESLANYGIPDLTSSSISGPKDRERFRIDIEAAIRRAEPRFQTVSVTVLEPEGGQGTDVDDRSMRFRIDALIYADPAPEPMIFDSLVDPATRSFSVVSRTDV